MTVQQVDPRDLTPSNLAALRTIRTWKLRPVTGGWRGAGSPFLSTGTVRKLTLLRLVARTFRGAGFTLQLTGSGLNTLAVADARAERRAS